MIYLLGTVLLLQSIFWWLFRFPIMSLDWIIELKFFNFFLAAFLILMISGSFPQLPLLGPLPWPKPSGLASTLIEWKGKGNWDLLRTGTVIPLEIEEQ